MIAKSMQEVAIRYDTYNNMISQSPKADKNSEPIEIDTRPQQGQLFEMCVEFDLHSVMSETYHAQRPVRPKAVIRKYK